MNLLKELLREVWGSGRQVQDQHTWHHHASGEADETAEWWIVTPDKKKYGPFKTKANAEMFFANRTELSRASKLIPAHNLHRM